MGSSSSVSKGDEASVNQMIADNPVMVFSKSYCPFCDKTKQLLTNNGVTFKAFELDEQKNGAALQAALKKLSGQNTVPNVYINKQHIGGNDKM